MDGVPATSDCGLDSAFRDSVEASWLCLVRRWVCTEDRVVSEALRDGARDVKLAQNFTTAKSVVQRV